MDETHPVFQCPPEEIQENPVDEFLERVAVRWSQSRDLGKREALLIVKDEAGRLDFSSRDSETGVNIEGVSGILAYIRDSASPLVTLDAVCYVFGLDERNGESMEAIAGGHGITRQAFSKHVIKAREEFGLRVCGSQRPAGQREKYREVQKKRWQAMRRGLPERPQVAGPRQRVKLIFVT